MDLTGVKGVRDYGAHTPIPRSLRPKAIINWPTGIYNSYAQSSALQYKHAEG